MATATVTVSAPLIFADFGADTLATRGMSIWNTAGAPAGPWPVALAFSTDHPCTITATSFQFNESAGSDYILDEHGVMLGLVNNPSSTLPGGGVFYGDENQDTYIDLVNNTKCLQDADTVTIEAVFLPNAVNLDWEDTNGDDVDESRQTINESSSCQWGALPGDVIALEDQPTYIGTAPNHNPIYLYKGLIDWISWKPEADYTGVDDPPR